jgi:mediator of RNA polymerase II transcription subunit 31
MNESPFQPPPPSVVNSEAEEQKIRFQTELEFVNALANPYYINCEYCVVMLKSHLVHSVLAQREYFKDKAVVNYLKYLLYWTRPEYVV